MDRSERRIWQGTTLLEAHRQLRVDKPDDRSILRAFLSERFAVTSLATSGVLWGSFAEVFEGQWPWSIVPRVVFLRGFDGPSGAELYDLRDACTKKLLEMAELPG